MSSFINTQYNNVGGVRDFILKKIEASPRLKELEVTIASEFIVHQELNQLSISFDMLKVTYND